jgi:hypothetical protein
MTIAAFDGVCTNADERGGRFVTARHRLTYGTRDDDNNKTIGYSSSMILRSIRHFCKHAGALKVMGGSIRSVGLRMDARRHLFRCSSCPERTPGRGIYLSTKLTAWHFLDTERSDLPKRRRRESKSAFVPLFLLRTLQGYCWSRRVTAGAYMHT